MQKNNEEGLPEIAKQAVKKNPAIWILFGVVVLAILSMAFHKKTSKIEEKPLEEVYSVPTKTELKNEVVPVLSVEPKAETAEKAKVMTEAEVALIRAKEAELQQRLAAPLMLVNNNGEATKTETRMSESPSLNSSSDKNTQFLEHVSEQKTDVAKAVSIGDLSTVIAEGSFIHATLESAANSDLPGHVRAIVSEPSYSEDGSQILIPAGSRLIGQYKSEILQGQSRFFLVWTRLITPSGFSLQLGSPGVDPLGIAGMEADEVDRHFWERFGTASLLSIIGTGAANLGVASDDAENSVSAYRTAMANSFAKSANQSLQQDARVSPTLKLYQGKPIMVFVARDLNFQGAMKQVKPRIKVF